VKQYVVSNIKICNDRESFVQPFHIDLAVFSTGTFIFIKSNLLGHIHSSGKFSGCQKN